MSWILPTFSEAVAPLQTKGVRTVAAPMTPVEREILERKSENRAMLARNIRKSRKWRAKNQEQHRAIARAWYHANKERSMERVRAWRAKNPEKYRSYRKSPALAAWRERNRERLLQWGREYRARRKAMRTQSKGGT